MVEPDSCPGCAFEKLEDEEQQKEKEAAIGASKVRAMNNNRSDVDPSRSALSTAEPVEHTGPTGDYFNPLNDKPGVRLNGRPPGSPWPNRDDQHADLLWALEDESRSSGLRMEPSPRVNDLRFKQPESPNLHPHFNPSFFSTAPRIARPSSVVASTSKWPRLTPTTEAESTLPSTAPASTSTSTAETSPSATASPPPLPRWAPNIKVCGFHMHALEWHAMQGMDPQSSLTLTGRARCPVFNLSVTRWLDGALNQLPKEPFNTVLCTCGESMVVSSDIAVDNNSSQTRRHTLACPRTVPHLPNVNDNHAALSKHASTESRIRIGRQDTGRYAQESEREDKLESTHNHRESCLEAISLKETSYSPRNTPIHTEIDMDDWLSRWLQPKVLKPEIRSILKKKKTVTTKNRARMGGNHTPVKRANFKHPVEEDIPIQPSSSTWDDGSIWDDGHPMDSTPSKSEWPLPEWSDGKISDEILNGEVDVWSDALVSRLDKMNVFQTPVELLNYAVHEAIKDARRQAQEDKDQWQKKIDAMRPRFGPVEKDLQDQQAIHAELVQHINEMKRNAQDMLQMRCRICYEGSLTHAVLPCFHLVMCGDCARQVSDCIVCRVRKTGIQRVAWG
ncbi:hypothetical protein BGZ99_007888 [Dissophora globulifera]|uniref:RING-type domain-containing protein n=1 Tax=Dissophora globulifera TaxID=979702 RepID=A0A9P6R8J5_9FUNG|nr:hypothetical protein BGZ99_007888 [Dissophora globulifera]